MTRFQTNEVSGRIAVVVGRTAGRVSRVWGQRGLGTIFKTLRRAPLFGRAVCRVAVEPDATFETEVFEPYWGPTLVGGRPYEPEVDAVMRRLGRFAPVLVDCGANNGYWSILATSRRYGFRAAIAIEANPPTYAVLSRNASLSGDRIRCVHRAVADVVGRPVHLAGSADHAVAHIGSDTTGPVVDTTTIDHEIAVAGWTTEPLVLKLDVEGYEGPALAGAEHALAHHDSALVFEDFADAGFDTVRLVAQRDYSTYYVDTSGRCRAVASVADARRHAAADVRPGRARNFVAVRPGGQFAEMFRSWCLE